MAYYSKGTSYNPNYYKRNSYSNYSSFNTDDYFDAALKKTYGKMAPSIKKALSSSNGTTRELIATYGIRKIGDYPKFNSKVAALKPQRNDFLKFAGGEIYPQRQDLPAALYSAMYKGNRSHYSHNSVMPEYYNYSLGLAKKLGSSYKPLNKDDLAYALDLDVKNRGSAALRDFYNYETELAKEGVNINGKWRGGKFGSNTQSS